MASVVFPRLTYVGRGALFAQQVAQSLGEEALVLSKGKLHGSYAFW